MMKQTYFVSQCPSSLCYILHTIFHKQEVINWKIWHYMYIFVIFSDYALYMIWECLFSLSDSITSRFLNFNFNFKSNFSPFTKDLEFISVSCLMVKQTYFFSQCPSSLCYFLHTIFHEQEVINWKIWHYIYIFVNFSDHALYIIWECLFSLSDSITSCQYKKHDH